MSSVIAVENLSKKYIIGHQKQAGYTNLREVLAEGAKRIGEGPGADPSVLFVEVEGSRVALA